MYPNKIVFDVDGVLTDGKLNIDCTGQKMFKSFHTRDVRSIREMVARGYEVYLVTADDWPGGKAFAEKVGAEFLFMRDKSGVKEAVGGDYIAVGDDAWDRHMLNRSVSAFCPADADHSVNLSFVLRLKTKGGCGVAAELLHLLTEQL